MIKKLIVGISVALISTASIASGRVVEGVVLNSNKVTVEKENQVAEWGISSAGAVIGGIAGRQIGQGDGTNIAQIATGVAGAIAGNKIARSINSEQKAQLIVKLTNGRIVNVDSDTDFAAGTEVYITEGADNKIRVFAKN